MGNMITVVKSYLDLGLSKELKELMTIPSMTKKVAKVLFDNTITTIEEFIQVSADKVAQYLKLAIGFEVKDLEELENQSEDINKVEHSSGNSFEHINDYMLKEEDQRLRLVGLVLFLQNNAKKMLNTDVDITEKRLSQYMEVVSLAESDNQSDISSQESSISDSDYSEEDSYDNLMTSNDEQTENPKIESKPIHSTRKVDVMVNILPSKNVLDCGDQSFDPDERSPKAKIARISETPLTMRSNSANIAETVKDTQFTIGPRKDLIEVVMSPMKVNLIDTKSKLSDPHTFILRDEELQGLFDDLGNQGLLTSETSLIHDKMGNVLLPTSDLTLSQTLKYYPIPPDASSSCIRQHQDGRMSKIISMNEGNGIAYYEVCIRRIGMAKKFDETTTDVSNKLEPLPVLYQEEAQVTSLMEELVITENERKDVSDATIGLLNEKPVTTEQISVYDALDNNDTNNIDFECMSSPPGLHFVETKKSPYLSPFTASKVKTPGKYLYYPLNQDTTPEARPQFATDVIRNTSDFKMRHVSDSNHCYQFLLKLEKTKCISFDLVFRR